LPYPQQFLIGKAHPLPPPVSPLRTVQGQRAATERACEVIDNTLSDLQDLELFRHAALIPSKERPSGAVGLVLVVASLHGCTQPAPPCFAGHCVYCVYVELCGPDGYVATLGIPRRE
jgi:hypothetical protein